MGEDLHHPPNTGQTRSGQIGIMGDAGGLQVRHKALPTHIPAEETTIGWMRPGMKAGDAFTVYPGCDKTRNTCLNKFNNLLRFRGFPYTPENSIAV